MVVCLTIGQRLLAQSTPNLREMTIPAFQDSILITRSFIPINIHLFTSSGLVLDSSQYHILYPKGILLLHHSIPNNYFPLKVNYTPFPFDLAKPYRHKNLLLKSLDSNNTKRKNNSYYSYSINKKERNLLGLNDFQKSGNISRAISVGNNQNVSVLSHLNLQIAGRISPELELIASVSDDNIPIQPDGNTQQLQDFDKVFIQLKHKKGQLTAGDFEMKSPSSYFLNYYKKAQGISASFHGDLQHKKTLNTYASIALSRGKYARNIIKGIEGNQGPYKLMGANFERVIVILSGTEKVYIDGKLLQRGQNYDYIINYNTAEISFMPTIPITKDKRITVEFQYTNRSYARYLANAGINYSTSKWNFATHYYVESDLKDQPLDQNLTPAQKQLLHSIGDSLQFAISPSVDSVGFNTNQVLYKKIDSLGYSPVYVYSTSSDSAFFHLAFTMVGAGNGNYIRQNSNANGRVFRWVAPINGIKQGDYDPIVLLITPKKKQMISSIVNYHLGKTTLLHAELAISNEDVNTFSPYDKTNNTAPAFRFNINNTLKLDSKPKSWKLNSKAYYEFINANFRPIERFRSIEFNRDWNLPNIEGKQQQLLKLQLQLEKNPHTSLSYIFQDFRSLKFFTGQRNALLLNLQKKTWNISGNSSLTTTRHAFQNTQFLRHHLRIEKKFKFFNIGLWENAEKNKFKKQNTDSLLKNSYSFQEVEIYTKLPDTSRQHFSIHYKWRQDNLPLSTKLSTAMVANEIGLRYSLLKAKNNKLKITANYRQLSITNNRLSKQKPQQTTMGRIEHILRFAKGSIQAQSFYQLGSGMETAKSFSYIEVAPGQGVYSWNDYNNNGVKELNEFEIAAFQDQANYIRIYVPGTDYIKTYNNQFSTVIMINPSRLWRRSEHAILRLIAHFTNKLTYQSSLKTLNKNWVNFANPLNQNISDTALMNLNTNFRNTFYFNRSHPKFGADYTYWASKSKLLMMNGYESRLRYRHKIKLRWNINRQFLLQSESNTGNKKSLSDYFKNKEYNITFYGQSIKFTYQPNRIMRISIPLVWKQKQNATKYGGQESKSITVGLQAKYSLLKKGSWTIAFNKIDIKYNAESNGSVAFEMLEGLLPGSNYTWNINYQRTLLKNLQLSLLYSGRKNKQSKTVHIGSIQLRAYF